MRFNRQRSMMDRRQLEPPPTLGARRPHVGGRAARAAKHIYCGDKFHFHILLLLWFSIGNETSRSRWLYSDSFRSGYSVVVAGCAVLTQSEARQIRSRLYGDIPIVGLLLLFHKIRRGKPADFSGGRNAPLSFLIHTSSTRNVRAPSTRCSVL